MIFNILNHIYSALFILSLIVFFEVLFATRKNKVLKTTLLVFVSGVLSFSAANIYCSYYQINRLLLGIHTPILAISVILLLSIIGYNKVRTYIIIFSLITTLSFVSILIYFSLFKPTDINIILSDESVLGNNITYIRLGFVLVIACIFIKIYTDIMEKYKADNIYYAQIRKWVINTLFIILIIIFANIFKLIFGAENLLSKYLYLVAFYAAVISILFRPKFLNNSRLSISLGKAIFNKVSATEVSEVTFVDLFFNQLYFLNADASLEDFSKKLGISSENLYRYIYKNYKSGFNDLINENRVKYFTQVVKSKKYRNYTIDALSQLAGFSSRHHLYKPFKKFHGGVPSDFLKSLDYNI